MKDKILDTIQQVGDTASFVELERSIEGFGGDLAWGIEGNIFFWFSLSQEAINALESLAQENLIKIQPAIPLIYMIDGAMPNVPVAKRRRKYKHPRWFPVVFNLSSGKPGQ